jgi:diadenosine tetraphosphate (Ap4A) HIT family hydrolase
MIKWSKWSKEIMEQKQSDCLFCNISRDRIIAQNDHAYAIRDGFPVTEFHTLVIPKKHVDEYFGLTNEQLLSCHELLHSMKSEIRESDEKVEGFNIGMNSGVAAGQTVFHCHIHLIPRRKGDVSNPRGGVRHVIPDKANY